jgi:transcription elongation factor Elf1
MIKVISRGGVVGILPEGHRSLDGRQAEIADGIAKLIKLYSVPVVAVVSNGAYLTWPRWSGFARKGLIETELKLILTPEEISRLSIDEIMEIVLSSLYYNDYEWNRKEHISYSHRRMAEKIDLIIHECPKCGNEKSMISKDSILYCRVCGNKAIMDEHGFLRPAEDDSVIFEDTVQWFSWQKDRMLVRIKDDSFSITSRVLEYRISDSLTGSFRNMGSGELHLNNKGLTFEGNLASVKEEIFFPPQVLETFNPEFGVNFELTDGKTACRFFLEDAQDVIRIDLAVSQLKKSTKIVQVL